jgi:FMN reductase
MSTLVVSTALRAGSKTSAIARALAERFTALGEAVRTFDLAEIALPLCDGGACYQDPAVVAVTAEVRAARAVVLCFPVYNYQANAAAKNFIEVTNDVWNGKVAGLVANAGTERSFLAPLALANSLMVDHRCLVVPRFVFVGPAAFAADGTLAPEGDTVTRLGELARDVVQLSPHWPA